MASKPKPKVKSTTKKASAKPKGQTIDDYLANVRDDQREALEKLRQMIKAAVPKAEECINYGVCAFRLDGDCVAGFGAGANHCTYYPMSGSTTHELRDELEDYETSKGSIRFAPEKPLPARLIQKLIKTRIAELKRNRDK